MALFRTRSTVQQRSGDAGEDRALAYLQQQGLVLIERNFSCKGGELDLIMQADTMLVFVEVRRRATAGFGSAAASITVSKQRRLVVAAQRYLQRYCGDLPPCRFDVVAIDGTVITWFVNAFDS